MYWCSSASLLHKTCTFDSEACTHQKYTGQPQDYQSLSNAYTYYSTCTSVVDIAGMYKYVVTFIRVVEIDISYVICTCRHIYYIYKENILLHVHSYLYVPVIVLQGLSRVLFTNTCNKFAIWPTPKVLSLWSESKLELIINELKVNMFRILQILITF